MIQISETVILENKEVIFILSSHIYNESYVATSSSIYETINDINLNYFDNNFKFEKKVDNYGDKCYLKNNIQDYCKTYLIKLNNSVERLYGLYDSNSRVLINIDIEEIEVVIRIFDDRYLISEDYTDSNLKIIDKI